MNDSHISVWRNGTRISDRDGFATTAEARAWIAGVADGWRRNGVVGTREYVIVLGSGPIATVVA